MILAGACAGSAGDNGFHRVSMTGSRIFAAAVARSTATPETNFAMRSLQSPPLQRSRAIRVVTGISGLNRAPDGGRVVPTDCRPADCSNTYPEPAGWGCLTASTAADTRFSSSSRFAFGDLNSTLSRNRAVPATKPGAEDSARKPAVLGRGPGLRSI